MRKMISVLLLAALLLGMAACGKNEAEPVVTANPYEGMIQVPSGHGSLMWVDLHEELPVNSFESSRFYFDGNFVRYTGKDYAALKGIDVSEHQQTIDWAAVKADGIEFAMIRAGYRGYSEGGLYEDAFFRRNIEGALENGIRVGVYFFSQAINVQEAEEEADYLISLLADYDISMPVAFDWEAIGNDDARTDNMDGGTLTDCAIAFCEKIKAAGYDCAIYAYRYLAYFYYDLPRLTDYRLWMGAIGSYPDFYYKHDMWQYSITGKVDGIEGDVDLNLMFIEALSGTQAPRALPESDTAESAAPAENSETEVKTP